MRILLVAYDYPPTQSPRSLRWRYLTRELALLGHEVHVLAPDLGDSGVEMPQAPGRVVLHGCFPGPFGSLVAAANRKRDGRRGQHEAERGPAPGNTARLNWRGRMVDAGKRFANLFLFPDVRAEWAPWARRALRRLLSEVKPDVVVTSHEPASTLAMGLLARREGFPWVADLGDPVCAAYTAARWRKRAWALEARVCTVADRILVTNEATRALLSERHGLEPRRCTVLSNGYDDRRALDDGEEAGEAAFDADRLELVYAGRLYGYRDPAPLLRAVANCDGVRLTLVVPDPPPADTAEAIASSAGGRLRVLGPQPHARVLRMLERADILVNFGDQGQPVRTPAKIFEYFGIERPMLHVHSNGADATADLLAGARRGWSCPGDAASLTTLLADLRRRKHEGTLHHGLDLAPQRDYAHSALGRRLEAVLQECARANGGDRKFGTEASGDGPAPVQPTPKREPDTAITLVAGDAQVAEFKSRIKAQASEIAILNQRVAWLDAHIVEIQASRSWRITAPLRAVSTRLQKIRAAAAGRKRPAARAARQRRLPAALDGEDTFVLYRIIGNDLYPRHQRGQAIANLEFILAHEPALEGCEKRFVLNRILDPEQERALIAMLEQAGFGYSRVLFEPAEYARTGFDTDALPEPGFLCGESFDALDDAARSRLLAALYRHKNNCLMNNNGARNAALEDGRGRAKWILPWDGNCFLTRDAWNAIRRDVGKAPGNRYFVVPMARMQSNDALIGGGTVPEAGEEPQIIFRADARERFDPAFCYGRRPKVELLWRLGVAGPWDDYADDPWDQPRPSLSPDAVAVGTAGWVARLSSGMRTLEANSGHAPLHRGLVRSGAILSTLRALDVRLAKAVPEQPTSIRPWVLREEVAGQDAMPLKGVVDALLRTADSILASKDERISTSLQRAFDDSLVLAFAWSFAGHGRYADSGAHIIQRVVGAGAAGTGGIHHFLDAVRIFENAGAIAGAASVDLRAWLAARLEWLVTSPDAISERRASGHRGVGHDLQVASIAAFLDDQDLLYATLARAQSRIRWQFEPAGRPRCGATASSLHKACLHMQRWSDLAELASRWGVDLWGYRASDGGSLGRGVHWLLSRQGAVVGRETGFDWERLAPIQIAACESSGGAMTDLTDGLLYATKPLFPPGCGIRPFWSLASYGRTGSLSTRALEGLPV